MIIPPHLLDPATLTRLIEDFVTRDGTDNGDNTSLESRVEHVRHALSKGVAVIVFNPLSEQSELMLKQDVPKDLLQEWTAE